MTTGALEGMVQVGPVELRAGHRGEKIGVVEECRREGERLRVKGRLEEKSPRARALWERLRRGVRMALSVGGRKRVVRRYSPVAGRYVRMIEDASLEHVAVCGEEEARNGETEVVASGERGTSPPGPLSRACGWGEGESKVESGGGGVLVGSRECQGGDTSPPGPLSRACGWGEGELGGESHPLPSLATPPPRGEEGEVRRAVRQELAEAEACASHPARSSGPSAEPGRRRSLLVGKTGRTKEQVKSLRNDNDELWKGVL